MIETACPCQRKNGMAFSTKKSKGAPRQLKHDEEYETAILEQLKASGVFDETLHPQVVYNLISHDIATQVIEDSILNKESLGEEHMNTFVSQRLISPRASSFTATFRKRKAPTFANLYDSPVNKVGQALEIVRADRSVLQRLASAYEAGRQVDLQDVASHELLSIPIAAF